VTCGLSRIQSLKAGSVPSFDARRNSSLARHADSSRQKSKEGGLSRGRASLYAKIDIFFSVHGKSRLRLERSRKQMLNV
jgi:hypothetical protein